MTYANSIPEPKLVRVTCYHYNSGITASGTVPMQGRTCGAKREDIGKAALIYRANYDEFGNAQIGELISILVVEDTGSAKRLKNGSVDIFRDSYNECLDWVKEYGDYCFVQIIPANG